MVSLRNDITFKACPKSMENKAYYALIDNYFKSPCKPPCKANRLSTKKFSEETLSKQQLYAQVISKLKDLIEGSTENSKRGPVAFFE